MTPHFEVVEARRYHCGMMARAMRRDHLAALARAGVDPHRELIDCFGQSAFRKAWLIDGRLAALGGVTGTLMSGDGMVWLALTEEATRYPRAVIAEARRQLDVLTRMKRRVRASVLESDPASLRMAIFLRFRFIGGGWDGPAETKGARRLLAREIAGNAESRIVVDGVPLVPMEYRQEAA